MRAQYIAGRALHALLVLSLAYLLIRALYYGFSVLKNDAQLTHATTELAIDLDMVNTPVDDKPSPQRIVSVRG